MVLKEVNIIMVKFFMIIMKQSYKLLKDDHLKTKKLDATSLN
jgi:hypothetical protein